MDCILPLILLLPIAEDVLLEVKLEPLLMLKPDSNIMSINESEYFKSKNLINKKTKNKNTQQCAYCYYLEP